MRALHNRLRPHADLRARSSVETSSYPTRLLTEPRYVPWLYFAWGYVRKGLALTRFAGNSSLDLLRWLVRPIGTNSRPTH